MTDIPMGLTVNGRLTGKHAKPGQRLLDYLRDDLGLTGTKEGCGAGECGTCSVFVDGKLIKSCLMFAVKANGSTVETIEGLAGNKSMTILQQAFHKTGASQCGYCIPGMVMAATSMLRENPKAEFEEIKERMGGNICRCTGYSKIFEAIEMARDVAAGKLDETVLDEVDAPLDDANVERFCNMLQEMCAETNTRFLVITHHALTMSRVDRLFGVTMAERGVSQLVSVDLETAESFREAV